MKWIKVVVLIAVGFSLCSGRGEAVSPCSVSTQCAGGGSCTSPTIYCNNGCYCMTRCGDGASYCACTCLDGTSPAGIPGNAPLQATGTSYRGVVSGSSSYSLATFGAALEQASQWGVEVSGTATVTASLWTGTSLQDLLENIGADSGFSVELDFQEHMITLTGE